jgi:uncharacterized membrane protein
MAPPKRNNEVIVKQLTSKFPKIGGNEARQIVQIVSRQVSIKSGPYPSPEDYDYYNEIDPDLTTQMKKMAAKEQDHQHDMDKRILDKEFSLRRVGQILAFSICIVAIVGGFYTVLQGHETGGTIIASIGLVGIVGQFLKK